MIPLRPSRSRLLLLTALALLISLISAGCSVDETLPFPDCIEGGSALIAAQSVPTADLVPCLTGLPNGWDLDSVTINQDGTVVRLDSDRAGDGAAHLRFAEECDLGGAISVPGTLDGAERFELIERVEPGFRASRFYVFRGGCAWWDFDFVAGATSALSVEVGDYLSLVTRVSINEGIRESFIDEEL